MLYSRRLSICLTLVIGFGTALSAQERKSDATPASSTVIAAAAAGENVRFSAPAGAAQIRLQIVSSSGESLFDSAWKDGNVLDWQIESPGRPLTNGSYRCTVMVKDLGGHMTVKEAAFTARDGHVSIDPGVGNEGLMVVGSDESGPKITALTHDGQNGAIVSTSGDLMFRFGQFLAGKDTERMRLTAEGNLGIGTDKPQARLDVAGLIRTNEGIMFPDGTILTSAAGVDRGGVIRQRPSVPVMEPALKRPAIVLPSPTAPLARPTPGSNFTPLVPQFVVDDNGVRIGTKPAFGLSVAGDVNLSRGLAVGGDVNLSRNLALPATTATAGVITLGGSRFAYALGGNTFLGPNAGNLTINTLVADANTAVGEEALFSDTNGDFNTANGSSALYANTTGGANTALGYFALYHNNANYNTAVGYNALQANVSGTDNTAVGQSTLQANTASNNTALGASALSFNVDGANNTAVGRGALQNNRAGANTAVGATALNADNGGFNTAVGFNALINNTGAYNIAVGQQAGDLVATGGANIYIGNEGVDGEFNTIRIGTELTCLDCGGQQNRIFIAGALGTVTGGFPLLITNSGRLGVATSSRRYKFDIADMAGSTSDLMRLRPVTFRYLAPGDDAPLQYGLIAEEVAEVYPEMVARNKDGQPETVMYQFLAPMLLNEVQKQHRQIEDQQKTIDALAQRLSALERRAPVYQ